MRSGLSRLLNQSGPPVPLVSARSGRGQMFNLGAGRQSREAQMRAYHRSGTIFSIVSLLQSAPVSAEWRLYKKQPPDGRRRYTTTDRGSDQRVEIVQHAALTLWGKPNEFLTGFEFREGSNQHLELTGETFWVLNREGTSFPTAMWYVNPSRMEPVPSPDDYLLGWLYNAPDGTQIPLQLDEVILEKLPDPLDPFRGAGPVGSIMANIEQQDYATQYQRNLFIAGADPGGVITVDKRLSEPEFDQLVDRWREAHQGVARAGRVGVLENGASWISGGHTNKDLEYGNLRLANRDELREAWRLHKHMLGSADDVNRANAQTAEESFVAWQDVPRLDRRKNTLNCKLLPMFYPSGAQIPAEFDYDDPSPGNREEDNGELLAKSGAASTLVAAGFDPDDVLEVVGLPSMDIVEKASQAPALPPGWVPEQPGGGGNGSQDRQRVTLTAKRDPAAKVFELAAEDYPADALAWMHHAKWTGPVKVPADHIIPDMQWLSTTTQEHVDDFVALIRRGKKLRPCILVKTPGDKKPHLVDGHHRYLADVQEGQPVRAFIGVVDADHGDWETMHNKQLDGKPKPANRAARLRYLLANAYIPVDTDEKTWFADGPDPCPVCLANQKQGAIPASEAFSSGDMGTPAHPHCECDVVTAEAANTDRSGRYLAALLTRVLSDGWAPFERIGT